jgi:hypothetical protein
MFVKPKGNVDQKAIDKQMGTSKAKSGKRDDGDAHASSAKAEDGKAKPGDRRDLLKKLRQEHSKRPDEARKAAIKALSTSKGKVVSSLAQFIKIDGTSYEQTDRIPNDVWGKMDAKQQAAVMYFSNPDGPPPRSSDKGDTTTASANSSEVSVSADMLTTLVSSVAALQKKLEAYDAANAAALATVSTTTSTPVNQGGASMGPQTADDFNSFVLSAEFDSPRQSSAQHVELLDADQVESGLIAMACQVDLRAEPAMEQEPTVVAHHGNVTHAAPSADELETRGGASYGGAGITESARRTWADVLLGPAAKPQYDLGWQCAPGSTTSA